MGRVNTPALTAEQRQELERSFRESPNHCFRQRCQSILLKADGRNSNDVGSITGLCAVSVNSWVKRYQSEGLTGLVTKPGRGRKAILSIETDKSAILSAIKANRQRMRTAKAEWESQSGKQVSDSTFKNFLKALADDISV